MNKENKKESIANTKNILSESCDELNQLEDLLSNFTEDDGKEISFYSTDNSQELRKVLFKNTGRVLKARYNEF